MSAINSLIFILHLFAPRTLINQTMQAIVGPQSLTVSVVCLIFGMFSWGEYPSYYIVVSLSFSPGRKPV